MFMTLIGSQKFGSCTRTGCFAHYRCAAADKPMNTEQILEEAKSLLWQWTKLIKQDDVETLELWAKSKKLLEENRTSLASDKKKFRPKHLFSRVKSTGLTEYACGNFQGSL